MTKKRVRFEDHAKQEMRKANVTRAEVLFVLQAGIRRVDNVNTQKGITYHAALAYIEHRPIEVIFTEDATDIHVVTVYERGKYD